MTGCLERGLVRVATLCTLLSLMLASIVGPAAARESVIVDYAQEATAGAFTASFTIDGHPETRLIRLRHPERVAIDFSATLPATDLVAPPADGTLVASLRHGLVAEDRYRVIFGLTGQVDAELHKRHTDRGEVLSLVIKPAASEMPSVTASTPVAAPTTPEPSILPSGPSDVSGSPARPLTIVLDPGHGGIDEGAVSDSGTKEKAINLAMGLALRDALLETGDVTVVMTRDDDTFIPLAERSAIGRRAKADLFISIHADSIRYDDLRGATVYTLSETASDALSRQIAASENAADRFAGPEWQGDKPDVFDILIDLTRRETVSFSEHFASSLVNDLASTGIRMINRPKRSAGFKVLKAPDVPSVLVEMGFLSNAKDEKLLKDSEWREEVAHAIASSVTGFFRGRTERSPVAEGRKSSD